MDNMPYTVVGIAVRRRSYNQRPTIFPELNLSCLNGPDMHELYDIYHIIYNIYIIFNCIMCSMYVYHIYIYIYIIMYGLDATPCVFHISGSLCIIWIFPTLVSESRTATWHRNVGDGSHPREAHNRLQGQAHQARSALILRIIMLSELSI